MLSLRSQSTRAIRALQDIGLSVQKGREKLRISSGPSHGQPDLLRLHLLLIDHGISHRRARKKESLRTLANGDVQTAVTNSRVRLIHAAHATTDHCQEKVAEVENRGEASDQDKCGKRLIRRQKGTFDHEEKEAKSGPEYRGKCQVGTVQDVEVRMQICISTAESVVDRSLQRGW